MQLSTAAEMWQHLDRVPDGVSSVVRGMRGSQWSWIVPEGLWEVARPLLPAVSVRPQGGGKQSASDEAVFAAVVYVLVSGCAWRSLPPCFGVSKSTAHRWFVIWTRAGVWDRLHRAVLDVLAEHGVLDVSRVVLDSAHVRAKKGEVRPVRAPWTGVNPVPRCTSCPTGAGCLSWSLSHVATSTTVRA